AVGGIERGSAVAGMGERTGMVARLAPPAVGVRNEGLQQAHERAPLLHGSAEIMHGGLIGEFRVGQRHACFGEDVRRDCTQRRTNSRIGLQCRLLVRGGIYEGVHRRSKPEAGRNLRLTPILGRNMWPLHFPSRGALATWSVAKSSICRGVEQPGSSSGS